MPITNNRPMNKYKLAAFIRFETDKPIEHHDQNTIENGATDKLMIELEGFLKKRGITTKILSDYGDLEETD
jgi:predicted RNase H-related nuclease YkuK (DUF458 family)